MEAQENQSVALWKKIAIGVIAFVGFITTIKLAIIYYNANFAEHAAKSFCSINEFIDCDSVAKTRESQFFGIPLAFWGLFLYSFIALLMGAKKLSQYKLIRFLEVFKNPYCYISALGVISFTISMILLCVSLFQIKKLCILCAFTYVLDLFIGLIAMDYSKGGFVRIFKTSFLDFVDALKIKKYLIAFIVVALCAVGFLTYTTTSDVFAPHVKNFKSIQKYMKMNESGENPYQIKGNVLGNPNGDVKLHVYSDFRCPICTVYNIIIHKVVTKDFENVQVIHHNYPLDMSCNKYLKNPFHDGSCVLAKYAYAAEKQGNYWEVASQIYLRQPMTDYDVWMIALQSGLNLEQFKKDTMSKEAEVVVLKDIDEAVSLDIKGTPAVRINESKDVKMGAMSEIELKEYLIKAGAKEKHNAK